MNQLTRHFWFAFSALSGKFPLHSNTVYSVIPNRPALAEIVVVGSICIILALLSGIVIWFFILKLTKKQKGLASGLRLLSKQIPFGNQARRDEWSSHEEGSAWQRRIEKLKGFDFSALKLKRKKQKLSKEDKREREAKEDKEKQEKKEKPPEEREEKQEKKEKPPEERSRKQGKKEKSPGEGKEKRGKKPQVVKRQGKQKKLGKMKKTKSTVQLKHTKGKKSLAWKKLR